MESKKFVTNMKSRETGEHVGVLKGMEFGEPEASEEHSMEELKEMGYVGVYMK